MSMLKPEWRERYLLHDFEVNELDGVIPEKFNCMLRQINVVGHDDMSPRQVEEFRIFELIDEIGTCIDCVSGYEVGEMESIIIVFKRV